MMMIVCFWDIMCFLWFEKFTDSVENGVAFLHSRAVPLG